MSEHELEKKGNISDMGAHQLDLHQRLVAVIQQVARFPAVDTHDTKQKLSAQSKRDRCLAAVATVHNGVDAGFEILLQDILLCELALDVCCQPDTSQRPGLR